MKSEYALFYEKQNAAIERAFNIFTQNGNDNSITNEKIEKFLNATDGMEGFTGEFLRRTDRLSLLGQKCLRLGWPQMRQIYEYMIETEPVEDQRIALINWYATARSHFLSTENNFSHEERLHFANDMCRILYNALLVSPNDPIVAASLGAIYIAHPMRSRDDLFYLNKGAEWYQTAATWSNLEKSYELTCEALGALADINVQLKRWKDAISALEQLRQLCTEQSIDQSISEIDAKLAACRSMFRGD